MQLYCITSKIVLKLLKKLKVALIFLIKLLTLFQVIVQFLVQDLHIPL